MRTNQHVAVKCTYNNGGEGDYVGFSGTCSEELIKINTNSHVWCSQPDCGCRKYFENGFIGDRPADPCLESVLFKKWCFGAGTFHSGPKRGIPKRAHLKEGGISVLTTRFPGDREEDRKIVGLYKIQKVTNYPNEETIFIADKIHRIRLPLDEAKQLFFWDYYTIDSDKPQWGTGLLRYLSDEQIKKILTDLNVTVQSTEHKEIITTLLSQFQKNNGVAKGLRKTSETRQKRIAIIRKYGPGGEGENHKKLKNWVANNPQSIGLQNVIKHELEHVFLSGDAVDILFELKNGYDVVVEIETTVPLPGCHQAIKYRALRCAERMLNLNSNVINTVLVAWEVPQEIRVFCKKYNISYYEINR